MMRGPEREELCEMRGLRRDALLGWVLMERMEVRLWMRSLALAGSLRGIELDRGV